MATPDLTAEEMVARMTDDELLGLTPTSSRPSTGNRLKGRMNTLFPESAAVRQNGSRPSSALGREDGNKPAQSQLAHSASAPAVGALRPGSAADVKAQRAQREGSFHFKRQRRWLEIRNKQHCLSFTEQEINDFRRFFNALSKGKSTIPVDRFEDMLVCLDMAKGRKDVRGFLEGIGKDIVTGRDQEITFEDFLKAFESQLDNSTMDVLKLLLQGRYDSRDLDYPTFISERRRELIFAATGARGAAAQSTSSQIVRTFADLLEDRCYADFGMGVSNKSSEDGVLLMGGLGTMWGVACVQHGLSRTLTAEERVASYKKSMPLSPRTVVNNIVKSASPKAQGVHRMGGTLVIEAENISV